MPSYLKSVEKFWDEATQREFKTFIGTNFASGDIIPGTGGIRKIRWQGSGHGKRGGVRVIYYVYNENHPIYLLYAYSKNVQTNLTEDEKRVLAEFAKQLKDTFRTKEGMFNERK